MNSSLLQKPKNVKYFFVQIIYRVSNCLNTKKMQIFIFLITVCVLDVSGFFFLRRNLQVTVIHHIGG